MQQRRVSEEDLREVESMRRWLLERDEVRYLSRVATALIVDEIPLLIAEIRRLRGYPPDAGG